MKNLLLQSIKSKADTIFRNFSKVFVDSTRLQSHSVGSLLANAFGLLRRKMTIESGESRSRLGTDALVFNRVPADEFSSNCIEPSVSAGNCLVLNQSVVERKAHSVPVHRSLATGVFRSGAKSLPSEVTLDDGVERSGVGFAGKNSSGIRKILKPTADRLSSKQMAMSSGPSKQSASVMWCNIGRYRIEVRKREAKFFLDSTAAGVYHDRKFLSDFPERTKFRLRPSGGSLNWWSYFLGRANKPS